MEALYHILVSAFILTLLFFLLPLRWTILGKIIISIISSLMGILFSFVWSFQPTIQTILLHSVLIMTISFVMIKRGASLFMGKKVKTEGKSTNSLQPLFSYQEQINKAKLAKPADVITVTPLRLDVKESINNYERKLENMLIDSQIEPISQEELSFILEEHTHETIINVNKESTDLINSFEESEDSTVEDEPGYLLDDWILPEETASSQLSGKQDELASPVRNRSLNIISIDEKRKEKSLVQQDEDDNINDLDWVLTTFETSEDLVNQDSFDREMGKSNLIDERVNDVSQTFEQSPSVNLKGSLIHSDDLELDELPQESSDDNENVTLVGRAHLLNDGIANLYKERADSVKKVKSKEDHADSTLKEQQQLLRELSNRFRASNE